MAEIMRRETANWVGCVSLLCNAPFVIASYLSAKDCHSVNDADSSLTVIALGLGFVLAITARILGSKRWAYAIILPFISFAIGIAITLTIGGGFIGPCFMN